jgi:GTP cyclohydrolase IA
MRAKPDRVAKLTAVTSPKPRAWAENGRPPRPADVAERAFGSLLQMAEPDDAERPGLLVTPARAARAWAELTDGYRETVDLTTFDADGYDEIVAVSRLPFYSLCEHHLLPFHGYAHIGTCRARAFSAARSSPGSWTYTRAGSSCRNGSRARLPNALSTSSSRVVVVVIDAEHLCMTMRGVQKPGSYTRTSVVPGIFREKVEARRSPRAVPSGLTKAGQQDKR